MVPEKTKEELEFADNAKWSMAKTQMEPLPTTRSVAFSELPKLLARRLAMKRSLELLTLDIEAAKQEPSTDGFASDGPGKLRMRTRRLFQRPRAPKEDTTTAETQTTGREDCGATRLILPSGGKPACPCLLELPCKRLPSNAKPSQEQTA